MGLKQHRGLFRLICIWNPAYQTVRYVIKVSAMDGNMSLQRQPFAVTKHLIEKYYELIQGKSSPVNRSSKSANHKLLRISKNRVDKPGSRHRKSNVEICVNSDDEISSDDEEDRQKEEEQVSFFLRCKSFIYSLFVGDYDKSLLIEKILAEKQHAVSYEEWGYAGLRLDELTDKMKWKQEVESNLYDYKLIEELTRKLREQRQAEDYAGLLYTIRTRWVRNLGNMGDVNLYRHSHVGTKFLIDEYLNESRFALDALVNQTDLDDHYVLGILQQTRRNIGRTALVLSGGGTFGLFHIGVLSTLFELDLLPRVISGSSAGAIVASILSAHYKDEIPELLERVLETDFNIFKDDKQKSESENLLIKLSRFLKNGTWFDNKHLVQTMIKFLGELTFREAYNRTGKILNITVSPASLFEQPRLLNNLTAPNVLIWSAVCASCSLPGIFPSSPLYEKDPTTGERREWSGSASVKFVDGSVDNDLPISRLSEMFNVDHIIACQVNVHVFPLLKFSLSCVGGDIEDEFTARLKQTLTNVYDFMANEAIHALELACELGIAKNALTKLRSVLSQQYSGDITILPDMKMLFRLNELLANPSKEFLLRETTNGARATWPKVSIIQNHCGQEFALDKAITALKGKIISSSSIKSPLQFSKFPVGLIRSRVLKDDINISSALDDNLFESESIKSLLLLQENSTSYRHGSSGKLTLPLHRSPTSLRHQRRKSETNYKPRNASKSVSFPVSFSSSRIQRPVHRVSNNQVALTKKNSSGHISFQKGVFPERRRSQEKIELPYVSNDLDWPHSAPLKSGDRVVDSSPLRNAKSRLRKNKNKKIYGTSTGSDDDGKSVTYESSFDPNEKPNSHHGRKNSFSEAAKKMDRRLSSSTGSACSPKSSNKTLQFEDDQTSLNEHTSSKQ